MENFRFTTILLWIPRVMAIAWAIFLTTLAVAAFLGEDAEYLQMSRTLVTHLVPSFCVLAILFIGWRRDGLAALGFSALGMAYFIALSGWRSPPVVAFLCIPSFGLSLAFFARMQLRRELRPSDEPTRAPPDEGDR